MTDMQDETDEIKAMIESLSDKIADLVDEWQTSTAPRLTIDQVAHALAIARAEIMFMEISRAKLQQEART